MQVKTGGLGAAKDLEVSPFEAARVLLSTEGEGLSLRWVWGRAWVWGRGCGGEERGLVRAYVRL